ncbi:MAG: Na(+)/H(+) antiporter subunit B [Bdellovibrionales bacterium CG10_big_fil_rev_8_21_14_0_10_45_34]|nr:MAG: Na(+)/H(+) antiporter subunit B [Bdellovibrionales bacterium CG10_big_fil_rev_8_21_14_0_10_45_34]
MRSPILETSCRFLMPILFLFSFFLLLRGHNEPGGGFIAGLVASGAYSLFLLSYQARPLAAISEIHLLGIGLLVATGSGLLSLFQGKNFMTGHWMHLGGATDSVAHFGTPVIFDIGVFLVVLGMVSLVVRTFVDLKE